MQKVKAEGKELRYWDFDAPVTVELENEKGEKIETIVEGKKGAWVRKPVLVETEVPETVEEILAHYKPEDIVATFARAIVDEAKREGGIAPEGTFSKAMVSAVVQALKANPRYAKLQRTALTEAVMRDLGNKPAQRAAFQEAFDELRRQGEAADEAAEKEDAGNGKSE